MTDTGLIDYMFRMSLPHLGIKEAADKVAEKKLETKHFYLPAMIFGTGLLLAVIALMSERCTKRSLSSSVMYGRRTLKKRPKLDLPEFAYHFFRTSSF